MRADKNLKMAKKDPKMHFFTHFQNLKKIMKFFSPNGNFTTNIGSMECKKLMTTNNSSLEFKTGPIEVKIMAKNDQK